jgi:predicted dehydrogenase
MASQREFRVGLVGYRGRGRGLAQAWQGVEGARLVAVADDNPEHLEAARAALDGVETYDYHKKMLDNANLDILTVATRAVFRPPIIRDAAAAGIGGIYAEKPIANSLAEADAMIEQCKASGTVLAIGHQRRWAAPILKVRDAIRDGAIGRPTHGFVYWSTARVGSNGTHFFDAISFMLDSAPVEVSGKVQYGVDLSIMDDGPLTQTLTHDPGAMGSITYENGARISVDLMADTTLPYTYMFCGTKGRIELHETGDWRVNYLARDKDSRSLRESAPLIERDFPIQPFDDDAAARGGYRELMQAIQTGSPTTSSGEDGRLALEIIVAFHQSSDAGMKAVSIPLADSMRGKLLDIH